jgi:hypothetical protein
VDLLDAEGIRPATPPPYLSPEQRALLEHLCLYHQKGIGPHHVTAESWRIVLLLACCLAASAGLIIFANQIPAFYSTLLLGFFAGSIFTAARYRLAFRRQWPLWHAIIDWKLADRLRRDVGMLGDHDA